MTRQEAKDTTLTTEALKQLMDETGVLHINNVTSAMLGDLFTFSKQSLKRTYEAGFRAGCDAATLAMKNGGKLLPHDPLPTAAPTFDPIAFQPMGVQGVAGIPGIPGPPGPPGPPGATYIPLWGADLD